MIVGSPGWPELVVEDLCQSVVDCVNRTAPVVERPTPFRMIRTTNVRDGFIDLSETRFVEEEVFKTWTRRQVPMPGDVILTREAPLGEVGIIRPGERVFLGQRLVSYRTDPELLDNRFLMYYLRSAAGQAQVQSFGMGSTVAHMRVPDAKKLKIPTPPIKTQRRIASILGAYDDLIEVNRRRVAVLEEMARGVFEEWFVRFRFPGHDSVPIIDTPDGPLPERWKWGRFNDLASEVRNTVSPEAVDPATPYVGLEHLPRRSTTLADHGTADNVSSLKARFARGDILFGKIRPYFHKVVSAPFDGVCSTDAIVWRPAPLHAAQALLLASSDLFVAHSVQTSNGTKMPRANTRVLANYRCAMADVMTSQRFEALTVPMIEQSATLQASNERLAASRDLLLPRLISGHLSVEVAERQLEDAA